MPMFKIQDGEERMKLYHGTTSVCLPSIVVEGLRPGREVRPHGPRIFCRRAVFFSKKERSGKRYAWARRTWFGKWHKNPGTSVLLRIDTCNLPNGIRIVRDWMSLDFRTFVIYGRISPEILEIKDGEMWRPLSDAWRGSEPLNTSKAV